MYLHTAVLRNGPKQQAIRIFLSEAQDTAPGSGHSGLLRHNTCTLVVESPEWSNIPIL